MTEITEKDAGQLDNIIQFAIKTCIVAFVISGCTIFVANWVIGNVRDSFRELGGRQFWTKIENELHRAAAPSSDLSPENKQRLLNDVRTIAARWRPFIEALRGEMDKPAGAN